MTAARPMASHAGKKLIRVQEGRDLHVNSIVNSHSGQQATILCHAISLQDLALVKFLLDNGADVNIGVSGTTPLSEAVECTDYFVFCNIITALEQSRSWSRALSNSYKLGGRTILQEIITSRRDLRFLSYLVGKSFDINGRSTDIADGKICRITDYTPFMYAVLMRDFELARELIMHGADPNIMAARVTHHRKRPVHALEVAFLHSSSTTNQFGPDVRLVLEAKANVDASDENGMSCLHLAAAREQQEACRILIACGVNVNARCHPAHGARRAIDFAETPVTRDAILCTVQERQLAFCMIAHTRLGGLRGWVLPAEIVRGIASIYL